MKKALYVFLVCLLMVVPLSGCQGSENNYVFETLDVTLDGEKTLSFDMNQEEVRAAMGEEPSETTEDDKKSTINGNHSLCTLIIWQKALMK